MYWLEQDRQDKQELVGKLRIRFRRLCWIRASGYADTQETTTLQSTRWSRICDSSIRKSIQTYLSGSTYYLSADLSDKAN